MKNNKITLLLLASISLAFCTASLASNKASTIYSKIVIEKSVKTNPRLQFNFLYNGQETVAFLLPPYKNRGASVAQAGKISVLNLTTSYVGPNQTLKIPPSCQFVKIGYNYYFRGTLQGKPDHYTIKDFRCTSTKNH